MKDYDRIKLELCEKIIKLAGHVIRENDGHDIRFYKKVYNEKEFDKI